MMRGSCPPSRHLQSTKSHNPDCSHRTAPRSTEFWIDAPRTVPVMHFVQAFSKAAFRHNHFASFN